MGAAVSLVGAAVSLVGVLVSLVGVMVSLRYKSRVSVVCGATVGSVVHVKPLVMPGYHPGHMYLHQLRM